MGPIKMIPLGCKSVELKHVMSFRCQTIMILNSLNEALNLFIKLSIDSKDYTIFINSEMMKCFVCREFGHVQQSCPNKNGVNVNFMAAAVNEQTNSQASRELNRGTAAVSLEVSAVEGATPCTTHEVSVVSENSIDASVEEDKVTVVSGSENMVSQSVTGLCEVQVDTDHDSHSKKKQMQLTKVTVNAEEKSSSKSVEDESSQEFSTYLQTEDSDNDNEDIESILDENNETGSSVQTQLTVEASRSKIFSLKQINDFLD